jgi:hypothetical protein
MTPPRKPTIDERLEALTQSLELMHHENERQRAEMRRLDRRERNAREALLAGISAYLQALKADDNGQPTE